ncbi:MAG: caspase family protein [Catenulispora sp.]|nr:caspase family protein [Catenulispora sp.]
MPLSDPQLSRVVLIGTSEYDSPNLEPLPAVAANVAGLRSLFLADDLWGLPAENCSVLLNCRHPGEVLTAVREAAEAATDTLVVYFAGHGLRSADDDGLYLALQGTIRDRMFTALRFADLRHEVLRTAAGVKRKVVLLDCCYSGAALQGAMSASQDIADRSVIDAEGTYVMTASASTALALAPKGATYTAFTGEVIETVSSGLPGGLDLLSMERIYRHVRRELDAKSLPIPQQRAGNFGGMISLVRNRAATAAVVRTAPGTLTAPRPTLIPGSRRQPPPDIPTGYEFALTAPAREVALALDELAAADRADDFAALLTGVGMRADAQRIVDLLGYLSVKEPDYASALLEALLRESPEHLVKLVDAAQIPEQAPLVADLMQRAVAFLDVAAAPVAEFARLLRIDHLRISRSLTEWCLHAAASSGPDTFVTVVGALRAAGLQEDVEGMLSIAPGDFGMDLATALRSAGRSDLAVVLYLRDPHAAAAQQSADEIATVVAAVRQSGRPGASKIVNIALHGCTKERAAELAVSLSSAGLLRDLDDILDHVVGSGMAGIRVAASALHTADHIDAEFELYRRAITRRPIDVAELLGSPPAHWSAGDASRVLEEATKLAPKDIVDVTLELQRRVLGPHLRRFSALVLNRPAADLADVAIGLSGRDSLARPFRQAVLKSGLPLAYAKVIEDRFDATDIAWLGRRNTLLIVKACQQASQFAAARIAFAQLTFEGIGDQLAAFSEVDWIGGLKFMCGAAFAIDLNAARSQYLKLMESPNKQAEARLRIEQLAMFQDPHRIPLAIDAFSRPDTRAAVGIIVETVGRYRSTDDIARIVESLRTRRSWRKWIPKIAVSVPHAEILRQEVI